MSVQLITASRTETQIILIERNEPLSMCQVIDVVISSPTSLNTIRMNGTEIDELVKVLRSNKKCKELPMTDKEMRQLRKESNYRTAACCKTCQASKVIKLCSAIYDLQCTDRGNDSVMPHCICDYYTEKED